MVVSKQLATLYDVEPEVITQIQDRISRRIEYASLAMQNIPLQESLPVYSQNFEYAKEQNDVGIAFEMDPVDPPDGADSLEFVDLKTPVAYTNYGMSFDQFTRRQQSIHSLEERLNARVGKIARRIDLITYMGDSKHSIANLGTASPATEISTALNFTTTALIASTFATAFKQMRSAGKYAGLVTPNTNVVVEMSPDLFVDAQGTKSTNEDFNGINTIQNELLQVFGSGSKVVENPYLGGSYTTNAKGVETITEGTGIVLMYPQNDMVMSLLQSPLTIRASALDETKGITFQPLKRHTRKDDDNGKATILIETGATT